MLKSFNDRVINEGFPEGWFIQDRLDSNEALLCGPHFQMGSQCVCTRPRAMTTDDWTPTARLIATALADPARQTKMMGAAVEEYLLIHAAEGDAERLGRRSAIRGLMVRLGKYHELCAALNVASPMSPTAYNGCTCSCHRGSGKMHIVACCSPSPETKAEDLSPEETAIATCEACGKHIQEGEPYLWGPETDFCGECAPTYQALIDEPEGFVNADGEPLTPEQCRAWFDEHIAAGGKATDSMATVDRTPVTLPQEHVTGPQRIETAPVEGFFLAETRDGDWIKAEHYDNPFGDKNTVISRRTGKWWSPARWMPLPEKQSDTEWEDNK